MSLASKTKLLLVRTPLHRPLVELNSARRYQQIKRTPIRDVRTAYCISPYKTGTSFIASMFDKSVSMHEPFHHTTLKHMHDHDFLRRRKAFLNLRVEASGFFASMAREFGELFPEDNMVFVIRDPSDWIGSNIDYTDVVQTMIHYQFGRELFWRKISRFVGDDFYSLKDEQQHEFVTDMLNFWLKVYREARSLANGHIIRLEDVRDNIDHLEHLFDQKAVNLDKVQHNANHNRRPFSAWNYVNKADFADAIAEFGY